MVLKVATNGATPRNATLAPFIAPISSARPNASSRPCQSGAPSKTTGQIPERVAMPAIMPTDMSTPPVRTTMVIPLAIMPRKEV